MFLDPRLPDRFWSKCIPEPNSGCWLWLAASDDLGYGYWSVTRGMMRASHIVAYTALIGEVPIGLELDHLCRVTCCCNPLHLEPVSHAENIRRGAGPGVQRARFAAMTHCKHGHEYSEQNVYRWAKNGRRQCRECGRIRVRERRARGSP
jgi:HNH endonuclease